MNGAARLALVLCVASALSGPVEAGTTTYVGNCDDIAYNTGSSSQTVGAFDFLQCCSSSLAKGFSYRVHGGSTTYTAKVVKSSSNSNQMFGGHCEVYNGGYGCSGSACTRQLEFDPYWCKLDECCWESSADNWCLNVQCRNNDYSSCTFSDFSITFDAHTVPPCDASGAIENGTPVPFCTSTLGDGSTCSPVCNTGYTLSGQRSCSAGVLSDTAVCNGNSCNAAGPISNGAPGSACTFSLAHGSSCSPTCNDGYTLSGQRSCSAGALSDTAVCNGNDCTASTYSSKDGSDGSVYCINGGTVGGSAGSCTCTCKPGYEGSGCETASACTASSNSTKNGSDGTLHCSAQYGTIGGTTGSCTCTCKAGYGGSGCETAGACSASSNSTKDGSDGILYCINGGTVSGSAGSCKCTCKAGYEGSSCQTAKSCTTEQYFDGSACQACPIFSSSTGGTSTSCTCAANTFASKSGNTWSCANCTVGATKAAGSVVPGTGGGEKEKDVCTASPTPPTETEKEKAEKTRDAMLSGIKNEKMKKKAKLLADAATTGKKVRKMSAKLTAPDEDTACTDYYAKAGL